MNKDLFHQTFSQIHASDGLKQEVLTMKQQPSHRKGLRIALIAAALVLLSAGSVIAASQLGQSRLESREEIAYTPTDPSGNSFAVQNHDLYLDLQTDADAPTSITEFYLPQLPEDYIQYHGFLYKDNAVVQYRWKEPDSYTRDIFLSQWAGGDTDTSLRSYVIHTAPDASPELCAVTWGGVEGLTVNSEPYANVPGCRLFFWSDGRYIYHLGAPLDYTDEQMETLVSGFQKVSDIRPWLIDMTEAEIQSALGS